MAIVQVSSLTVGFTVVTYYYNTASRRSIRFLLSITCPLNRVCFLASIPPPLSMKHQVPGRKSSGGIQNSAARPYV